MPSEIEVNTELQEIPAGGVSPAVEAPRANNPALGPKPDFDRIICGDNATVLAGFPDGCIDLTVTSPPYDNLRTYGGHTWDFDAVAQQLWRVTKPGGVVVWVVADATVNGSETGTSFRQALRFMEIGFRLHDTMIYRKIGGGAVGSHKCYWDSWEFMFVFSVGEPAKINRLKDKPNSTAGTFRSPTRKNDEVGTRVQRQRIQIAETSVRQNVWEYKTGVFNRDDQTDHPAPFPESLARDHILSWSNEGDVVLDPFAGSCTTCKMARLMGRRYIGIEVNPDYCEIGRKRMAQNVLDFGIASMEREAARMPLFEPQAPRQLDLLDTGAEPVPR